MVRNQDNDTYGDPNSTDIDCTQPTGFVADNTDSNDKDANPGADEYCDNHDDDCDGDIDEDGSIDADLVCRPGQRHLRRSATSDVECYQPSDYVLDNTDCRPNDKNANPGADEYCDNHDDDCDGDIDEDSSIDAKTWYSDQDGDTYGDPATSDVECYQPAGYVLGNTLRPTDKDAYPGADETATTTTMTAMATSTKTNRSMLTWYEDQDNDTYGDPNSTDIDCTQPTGFVADNTDCRPNDKDAPGADEPLRQPRRRLRWRHRPNDSSTRRPGTRIQTKTTREPQQHRHCLLPAHRLSRRQHRLRRHPEPRESRRNRNLRREQRRRRRDGAADDNDPEGTPSTTPTMSTETSTATEATATLAPTTAILPPQLCPTTPTATTPRTT